MSVPLILLVVVIVSLILGPVMMLKPRPEQQRREQLRLAARAQGLRFSMRSRPRLNTDTEQPGPTPCYFLAPKKEFDAIDAWALVRMPYRHEAHFFQDWDWIHSRQPSEKIKDQLKSQLAELPEGVAAITSGTEGVCVYWNESEGLAWLPRLKALLNDLRELG